MTKLVGILNLTPDSFSDGGQYADAGAIRAAALRMAEAGAAVIDVGAESTRPGATPLSPEQEWARLEPFFVEALPALRKHPVEISIDTRHPETATRALSHGVDWINDVSGNAHPDMADAVRRASCRLVLMHSLGVPADPAVTLPEEADPVHTLLQWAEREIQVLAARGIGRERIIFDPGIGFGKTMEQSWEIVRRMEEFRPLGLPLLAGHSRKSFLRRVSDNPAEGRDDATLAVSAYLAARGVDYLRVHAVARHAEMQAVQQLLL